MKSMKLLGLLLSTSAVLSACNSGSNGSQTPKLDSTTGNAKSTMQQHELTTPALKGSLEPMVKKEERPEVSKAIGVVITKKGNLDYYQDDKFVGVIHKFEDTPTAVQIAQVEDASNSTIIYVATHSREFFDNGDRTVLIHKCILSNNHKETDCSVIYEYKKTSVPEISGLSLDGYGNGYAISNYGLLRFSNNRKVDYRNISGNAIDMGGNYIFVQKNGHILKFDGYFDTNPTTVSTTHKFYGQFSVDKDMNGYAIDNEHNLYKLSNGDAWRVVHTFEDRTYGVSSIGSAVYVAVGVKGNDNRPGLLHKCDTAERCAAIDKFDGAAVGVSFRAY